MYKSACIKVTSYVTAADTATLLLVSTPATVRYRNMQSELFNQLSQTSVDD